MRDEQTLQGIQKELTQAINLAANAKNKPDRVEAASRARKIGQSLIARLKKIEKAME